MLNQKLLVSGAEFFADDYKINPYYGGDSINRNKAITEHEAILACFKEAGIELVKVDAPANCQDGVYTANWAITKNGKAVMSRLPKARKTEEPYAKQKLQALGYKIYEVPNNLLFSGQGDALRCGDYLFVGSGYRSEPEAQQFVAKTLSLQLVQLHAKPQLNPDGTPHINPETQHADSFFYDLDLALSVIDEHTIAYCPEAFDEESIQKIKATPVDKIPVSLEECTEGFACNLVSTGKHVIMSNRAPKLQAELEKRGLICLTPDVTELKKGGGYIRCISLWLD